MFCVTKIVPTVFQTPLGNSNRTNFEIYYYYHDEEVRANKPAKLIKARKGVVSQWKK